jgi:AraC-like DNA-binding protein
VERLLVETDLELDAGTALVGFASLESLVARFRRWHATTATRWRQQARAIVIDTKLVVGGA